MVKMTTTPLRRNLLAPLSRQQGPTAAALDETIERQRQQDRERRQQRKKKKINEINRPSP
jgi:hypothetical protein